MTQVVEDRSALRALCDRARCAGRKIGFVPTMGALHAGHFSLVDAARKAGSDFVVTSIFVNPMQFGPTEDLSKYPRTFDADLALCRGRGVDAVYVPDARAMYGVGFQTHVEVEGLTQGFEGAIRPTHFRGVTTVVLKLFAAVGPCVAMFGRKDYQQWRVLERMAHDLDLPVELMGCPIAREPDGLAMSSRNRYLDSEQRGRAVAIYRGLRLADAAYRAGERDASRLEQIARQPVQSAFDGIDYISLLDAKTLEPLASPIARPPVLLVAARIGPTRLLDNCMLGDESPVTE
jgi:pantoate--beta-alanine ligase